MLTLLGDQGHVLEDVAIIEAGVDLTQGEDALETTAGIEPCEPDFALSVARKVTSKSTALAEEEEDAARLLDRSPLQGSGRFLSARPKVVGDQ